MTALVSLLIRHALMLSAGFFTAHSIDGSSTVGIITGLLMLACVTAWSLAEKWLDFKPGQLTDSAMLRSILGALASQLVTAASAYFAVDANQPELLGVALVNAGLSKAGLHQKLASIGYKDAVNFFLLSFLSANLISCAHVKGFIIRHEAALDSIVIDAAHTATEAALSKLKRSAKQPVNVQPDEQREIILEGPEPSEPACEEPRGEALPACLKITPRVIVPRYGVKVAAVLRNEPGGWQENSGARKFP